MDRFAHYGWPFFEERHPKLTVVYRAPPNFMAFRGPPGSGNNLPQFPTPPDSAALVRYDLGTRKVDTVTFFKTLGFPSLLLMTVFVSTVGEYCASASGEYSARKQYVPAPCAGA